MTFPKKKKISKNGEESLLANTSQEESDISDVARIIASLVIGVQPYLDISLTQVMIADALAGPLDEETAQAVGEEIARQCKVTLPTDALGGRH